MLFCWKGHRAEVLFSKKRNQLGIHVERNVLRTPHRVKVRDQWNCHPVVPGHAMVAADYDTLFSRLAASQVRGRIGTDTREVHGSMACSGKGAVVAVGFSK
jgi:hypothetical protein